MRKTKYSRTDENLMGDPARHVDVIGTFGNVQLHAVEYPDDSIRFRWETDADQIQLPYSEMARMHAAVDQWVNERIDEKLDQAIDLEQ